MKQKLLDKLTPSGQEHVLTFWEELNEEQRQSLSAQVSEIDLDQLRQLSETTPADDNLLAMLDRATSPPAFRLDASKNRFSPEEAKKAGEESLRSGKLGVVVVAGGQGTRLGFAHPKGMFPIGPVSEKTLFQIHVEKIISLSRTFGVSIPPFRHDQPGDA